MLMSEGITDCRQTALDIRAYLVAIFGQQAVGVARGKVLKVHQQRLAVPVPPNTHSFDQLPGERLLTQSCLQGVRLLPHDETMPC